MSTSYYHLPIPLFISPFKDESAKTYQEVGNEANKFNISSMTDEEVKSELEGLQKNEQIRNGKPKEVSETYHSFNSNQEPIL